MKKILAVATSSAADIKGKRTGLWLSELTHFLDVVERAGFGYDLASPEGGKIPLDEGSTAPGPLKDPINAKYLADPLFKQKLENSIKCSDVDIGQYQALYLSGGHGTVWDFRQSAALQKLITELYSSGKFITGVCHGVSGFIDSKDKTGKLIVRDKVITGFSNLEDRIAGVVKHIPFLLEDELKKNGAKYKRNMLPFTTRVEVDGRLITGQNPQSAKGVGQKLVELLGSA